MLGRPKEFVTERFWAKVSCEFIPPPELSPELLAVQRQ
jgi:hypothetical protein